MHVKRNLEFTIPEKESVPNQSNSPPFIVIDLKNIRVSFIYNEYTENAYAAHKGQKLSPQKRLDRFKYLVTYLNHTNKKHLVIGDLNINTKKNTPVVSKYWQVLSDLGLTNHITQATRGKACLDHILTRGVNSCSTEIFEVPLKTDHKLVSISIGKTKQIQPMNVRKLVLPSDKVAMLEIPPIDFADIETGTNKLIRIISVIKQKHTFTRNIKMREIWYKIVN